MNTENSKTSESHRFRLFLTDKLNLKDPLKNIGKKKEKIKRKLKLLFH